MNQVYSQSAMAPYDTEVSSYPVDVRFPTQERYNRFFAVPALGYIARCAMLIPHLIILYVLSLVISALQLVLWIPVLFTGRYPQWAFTLVGGYIRWLKRVNAYLVGLSDSYPAFSLGDDTDRDMEMMIVYSGRSNRGYAVPIAGYVVKQILLIPHYVVLFVLGCVVLLTQLVAWIPVLATGEYPEWSRGINEGFIRWYARVFAFTYGLTDIYPPFQLGR